MNEHRHNNIYLIFSPALKLHPSQTTNSVQTQIQHGKIRNRPLYTPWSRWPYPPKRVTLILSIKFWFLHICKEHLFSFQMIPTLCKSADRFKSYWWINLATVESSILRNWAEKIRFAYNSITAVTIWNAWNCHKTSHLTIKSDVFEQKNAWSTWFWWKPKINIFDLQIENRRILYCV